MSTDPDLNNQQDEVLETPIIADGVREIFPVRMVTTSNVTDYRPRVLPSDAPEEVQVDDLGKAGIDSAPESVSSEDSTTVTAPPVLTTGVQIPAAPVSGVKDGSTPAAS